MGKSIVDKIDNQFFKNIYLKMPKIFAGEFISPHICGTKNVLCNNSYICVLLILFVWVNI